MSDLDAAIIGAGVVGLACGVALARRGMQVVLLEAEPSIGTGTSSRNSEVIHAGIYYPVPSMKARLCVEGRRLLYDFCADRGVPHRKVGKIIFAADSAQCARLNEIAGQGREAGVDDLEMLSAREVSALEPELRCDAAILSPSTGIIDSHAFMLALEAELSGREGQVVCNTRVERIQATHDGWAIHVAGFDGPALTARTLVNAAGLNATSVAHIIEGLGSELIPEPVLSRGCYFNYNRSVPFRHLIYPIPVPGGLGTHLTLDLAGRARFGPNVQWIDSIDYSVDASLHPEFLNAARAIWPSIDPIALVPGFAGVRPKVRTIAGLATDFIISGPEDHGLAGLVNLFGIESPGLTASLALGEEVASRLDLTA